MKQKFSDPKIQEEYEKFEAIRISDPKHGKGLSDIFNNFCLRLPGSNHRDFWMKSDRLDKIQKEAGFVGAERDDFKHSDLYLNQTRRKFYETIDQVLREEGVYDQIVNLVKAGSDSGVIYLIAASSWFRLRKMGYSQRDLY